MDPKGSLLLLIKQRFHLSQAGDVGDYMAMLWMPPNPDHIKIQKITKVEPAEPEGMIGVWKSVSKDDLFYLKDLLVHILLIL